MKTSSSNFFVAAIVVAVLGFVGYDRLTGSESQNGSRHAAVETTGALSAAIANHSRGVPVEATGKIARLLSDDNAGARHQRFIVRLGSGQTLLVAHNIDVASRVPNLAVGTDIAFSGEYEWNDKGGVVHWTHHDPQGKHREGWIKYAGRVFQ